MVGEKFYSFYCNPYLLIEKIKRITYLCLSVDIDRDFRSKITN